jgi:hypothetical protein
MLNKFRGYEIATEIVKAVEALPKEAEIVLFKAGENMPITCAFTVIAEDGGPIPESAWNGERWHEIGYL